VATTSPIDPQKLNKLAALTLELELNKASGKPSPAHKKDDWSKKYAELLQLIGSKEALDLLLKQNVKELQEQENRRKLKEREGHTEEFQRPAGAMISRAAIVIGVNKTTALPELTGAVSDANAFAAWARRQPIETQLFTDEHDEPVTLATVFNAVKAVVNGRQHSQLIIYFAGHGFQNIGSEVWLLSGAPENPGEAVALEASIMAARESGLQSVVFISDCCRSIPKTLVHSRVDGGSIFPNNPLDPNVRPEIDRFFATLPSLVAVEAASATDAARRNGIFTQHLIRVHQNTPTKYATSLVDGKIEVVLNRPLKKLVRESVEDAVYKIDPNIKQLPDGIIESAEVYVGRVERETAPVPKPEPPGPSDRPDESTPDHEPDGGEGQPAFR
jgi:nicotinamidase-related amidase